MTTSSKPSTGIRSVLDRINERWPNIAGFAADLLSGRRPRKLTMEERRRRARIAEANREQRRFEQLDRQPLPSPSEERDNALDVLAVVRCDLRVSVHKAEETAHRHFGRWLRQLEASEILELCSVLEREAKR